MKSRFDSDQKKTRRRGDRGERVKMIGNDDTSNKRFAAAQAC